MSAASPRSSFIMAEGRTVATLVAVFSVVYSLYGVFRHRGFHSSYDLGIFDQAIWHLSRFEAPASSISGFSNILGDHFYPIIAVLAPFYWLAPAPETLIVSQAILLAASIVPVFLYLRKRLPWGATVTLCTAHGLFWGLQRAAAFDFHALAFAPLVIATALLALDQRRWMLVWVAASMLLLIKEDLIIFLTFLGLYLVVRGERWRGGMVIGSSLVVFFFIVGVIIPGFNDTGGYAYAGAFSGSLLEPWLAPVTLVTPPAKLYTALMWLAPFGFLSLGSPLGLLLIPFALTRFLSANELHWGTSFHYTAPLAPILVMSAGDALGRIRRRFWQAKHRERLTGWVAGACLLLASILPGNLPFWDLFSPNHYRLTAPEVRGYEALALIPKDASVVAQTAAIPHISQRDSIYVLDEAAPDADFVVASANVDPWPNTSYDGIRLLLDDRLRRGYGAIFEKDGWTVLVRNGSGP